MKQKPNIAIILVNWNNSLDTQACIQSLEKCDYLEKTILVVDNGSTDGSVVQIPEVFPHIEMLCFNENTGFVGGNNAGIIWAQERDYDYVLLLNNDTEVAPDFLTRLVEAARNYKNTGVFGPVIYYYSQPDVVWSAGGVADRLRGNTAMRGIGEVDHGQYGVSPQEVDFLTGCAMLVDLSIVEKTGLLDSRFFAYYEEVEWCDRIKRAGFVNVIVPEAKIWHKILPEKREASPLVHYYMTRNRLLYLKLTKAPLSAWIYTYGLDYARTLISWTLKPKWAHKKAQRLAMIKAICDYWQNCFGKANLDSQV